jgi:fumarate reductase subunit D
MAESVRELPRPPSEVLASLAALLEAAGWQTLERRGPLLVVQRGRHRATLAILGSLHGSLVRIGGSRGAVAAVTALLPAEAARPAPLMQREHRTSMAFLVSLLIGTLVALSLVVLSLWQAHHVGAPVTAPTPGVVAPLQAGTIAGPTGAQEPSPTPLPATPTGLVREFYTLLNRKAFDIAYSLLSERYQRVWPFDAFRAGYRTTQAIQIDDVSQVGDSPQVRVSVTATDLLDGQATVRRYQGQWFLVEENGQWRLDRGLMTAQP